MPVIDKVANDYLSDIAFVAVAGRGDLAATREEAGDLFTDNLQWGLDDSIWDLYGVPGQPASILIAQGRIVDMWFGAVGEQELRDRLDDLAALSA